MENKIKILVVDDSEPTRKFIGSILLRDGYNVDYAENGITALEKLFISKYDIVITDINISICRDGQGTIQTHLILIIYGRSSPT